MISKTLEQCVRQTEQYSVLYYERYVNAWMDRYCPEVTRNYYCKVSKQYWDLNDLLRHIKKFNFSNGSIINTKCLDCKSNLQHVEDLKSTYVKYKRWIDQIVNRKE